MAQQGKIISWNQQKGFGFIAPDNGEQDVFFSRICLAR
ncbi:cold-shock protein [Photobacterium angustum]|nr:cold shock domain-containing protein [Photobacterium angustum]